MGGLLGKETKCCSHEETKLYSVFNMYTISQIFPKPKKHNISRVFMSFMSLASPGVRQNCKKGSLTENTTRVANSSIGIEPHCKG